jgi:hypothetical protein
MRYLTHEFAHLDTLARARRWLVQTGFDPRHIETVTEGIPRIAIRVNAGQAAEAGLIINAAERSDPQGLPSFWDLARQEHIHSAAPATGPGLLPEAARPHTFVVAYRVPDDRSDLESSMTAIAMRDSYEGRPGR